MSFIPVTTYATPTILPTGPAGAKLAIVGESPGLDDCKTRKPFMGQSGSVLDQCLHAAKVLRSECYLTYLFKYKVDVDSCYGRKGFTREGVEAAEQLADELLELRPNIIVTLGNAATAALTHVNSVMKFRGYVFDGKAGIPVIPTIHPAAVLRGNYLHRYLIAADFTKAAALSKVPALIRPIRHLVTNFTTTREAEEWIWSMEEYEDISVDIEVLNYEIALVGLANSAHEAVSIPFGDTKWGDPYNEVKLWRALQSVLENPRTGKIFQNCIFDRGFLATKMGINVQGKMYDTMIAHHVMYPEFPKGLAFLGSRYCGTQAYWKDMVNFDDIKAES